VRWKPRAVRFQGYTGPCGGGKAHEDPGFEDRAGAELRRFGFVFRITANPALGYCSDLLAEMGATAVLAETPEIFGAEHLLVKRARNKQVAEKLLSYIQKYKELPEPVRVRF